MLPKRLEAKDERRPEKSWAERALLISGNVLLRPSV